MRITIVIPSLEMGGAENHVRTIVPLLRQRGLDINIYVLRGMLRTAFYLWKTKPNIVHFFLPKAYVLGSIAAMLAGCKCRVMSRRSLNNYQSNHWWLPCVERWLHSRTKVLIGNSHAVVEQLRQETDNPNIVLIHGACSL